MIAIPRPPKMNNEQLDALIRGLGTGIEGELGFWRFRFHGVTLICITDESHDRMRVMTPITQVEEMTAEEIMRCMQANFDRALDARYCINDDTLWGAFIHPLGSLTPTEFTNACHQVADVAVNYGTTYSSGGLTFAADPDTDPLEP